MWNNSVLHVNVILSHIHREGNVCANKIVNFGHSLTSLLLWDTIPSLIKDEFLRDKLGLPWYCFS